MDQWVQIPSCAAVSSSLMSISFVLNEQKEDGVWHSQRSSAALLHLLAHAACKYRTSLIPLSRDTTDSTNASSE